MTPDWPQFGKLSDKPRQSRGEVREGGERELHSITHLALQAREDWTAAGAVQQAGDGVGGLRV